MGRVITTDLRKMFSSKIIYLSILGLGIIFSCTNLSAILVSRNPGNAVTLMKSVLNQDMMLVLFLFCIVGGGFLYCTEAKYNYMQFEILRVGVKRFVVSKIAVSMLGGFLTAFCGMVLGCIGQELLLIVASADTAVLTANQCI